MFALTRRIGERLYIGDNVILEILDTDGQCARIGIDAPREVLILREELITPAEPASSADQQHAEESPG